jgi:hypothetical protein
LDAPSERAVPFRAGALTEIAEKVDRPPVLMTIEQRLPLETSISVAVLDLKLNRNRFTLQADASAAPKTERNAVARTSRRMPFPPVVVWRCRNVEFYHAGGVNQSVTIDWARIA